MARSCWTDKQSCRVIQAAIRKWKWGPPYERRACAQCREATRTTPAGRPLGADRTCARAHPRGWPPPLSPLLQVYEPGLYTSYHRASIRRWPERGKCDFRIWRFGEIGEIRPCLAVMIDLTTVNKLRDSLYSILSQLIFYTIGCGFTQILSLHILRSPSILFKCSDIHWKIYQ